MSRQKSGLLQFAEQELARIPKDDEGMQEDINKHILKMVNVFCKEGHSGFTANYTANILDRLLRFLPLSPIEDTPEDWIEVENGDYQHKRCSHVFKSKERYDGKAYTLYGKIFSDDGGKTWFSNRNSSEVIEFPYAVPSGAKRYLVDEDHKILSEYVV